MKYLLLILFFLTIPINSYALSPQFKAHAQFSPETVHLNEYVVLEVQFEVPRKLSLYSMTIIPDGPRPLSIDIESTALIPQSGFFGPSPVVKYDEGFETNVELHQGKFLYKRAYKVKYFTSKISIIIDGQLCDDKSCYNQSITISPQIQIKKQPPRDQFSSLPQIKGELYDKARVVSKILSYTGSQTKNPRELGLLAFIAMAALAGLGALLTPCVFPMIPVTISFFSRYDNKGYKQNLVMAAIYAGSIILVYSIPGVLITMLFGASSMNSLAVHPFFNLFIAALLIFFGLNLLGLFEIKTPAFLIQMASKKQDGLERKESFLSQAGAIFFMAVTFTIVSFSCTAGFIGGWVLPLASRGDALYPFFGMLAFSGTFALPFFFFALFPKAIKKIAQKSGDWMLCTKYLFGIIELAIALKFISNIDIYFKWGLISRDFVLILWSLIFVFGALYILNIFSLKTKTRIGLVKILLFLLLIAAAAKSYSGIKSPNSLNPMFEIWLPPHSPEFDSQNNIELTYILNDFDKALKKAKETNTPLFIAFSGYQCANCRIMESTVLTDEKITSLLLSVTRVRLYTDGKGAEYSQNRELQLELFDSIAIPFYAVLDPDTKKILGTFPQMTRNTSEFESFLLQAIKQHN